MRVAEPTRLVPPLLRRGSQQAARAAIGRALARAGCDVMTLAHRRVPAHLSFAFVGFDRAFFCAAESAATEEDSACGAAGAAAAAAKEVLDGLSPGSVQQVADAGRAAMGSRDAPALLRRVADEFETQARVRWGHLAAAHIHGDAETHARALAHVVALHCIAELLRRAARWVEDEPQRTPGVFNNELIIEADLDAQMMMRTSWWPADAAEEGAAEEGGGIMMMPPPMDPRPPSRRAPPAPQAPPTTALPDAPAAPAQALPAAPRSARGTRKVLRPLPEPPGQGGVRRLRS